LLLLGFIAVRAAVLGGRVLARRMVLWQQRLMCVMIILLLLEVPGGDSSFNKGPHISDPE
jgi:hypothetical protein